MKQSRDVSIYIKKIAVIALLCTVICYNIVANPFGLSYVANCWIIRLFIFSLFGWLIITLTKQPFIKNQLSILAILPLILSTLIVDNKEIYSSFEPQKIITFVQAIIGIVTFFWLFWDFLPRRITLVGYILIVNLFVSVLTFLPFGIPYYTSSNEIAFFNFSDYHPFQNLGYNSRYLLFDLRSYISIVSLLVFVLNAGVKGWKQACEEKYSKRLDNSATDDKNVLTVCVISFLYFIGEFRRKLYFFLKFFFKFSYRNFIAQFRKSPDDYKVIAILFLPLLFSCATFYVSPHIYAYIKNSGGLFSIVQVYFVIFGLLFSGTIFAFAVIYLKSHYTDFELMSKEQIIRNYVARNYSESDDQEEMIQLFLQTDETYKRLIKNVANLKELTGKEQPRDFGRVYDSETLKRLMLEAERKDIVEQLKEAKVSLFYPPYTILVGIFLASIFLAWKTNQIGLYSVLVSLAFIVQYVVEKFKNGYPIMPDAK